MLYTYVHFGWQMTACSARERLPPSQDPAAFEMAALARYRGFRYARPFCCCRRRRYAGRQAGAHAGHG